MHWQCGMKIRKFTYFSLHGTPRRVRQSSRISSFHHKVQSLSYLGGSSGLEQKYLNRHQGNLKLLRTRFRIRRKALYYAARKGSAENLKCFLKSIDDNNYLKTMLRLQDYRDLTVFHHAAYLSAEHLEVTLSCIEERQWDCFSLLSTACLSRPVLHVVENVETLHLIRCKLSPAQWIKLLKEVDDQSGYRTCLHSFFWKGNLECVKYILNTLDVEASMVLLWMILNTNQWTQ